MSGFGKLHESLYRGSMLGSPASVWIVWPYVIAHARPEGRKVKGSVQEMYVELHPRLMSALSSDITIEQIIEAIRILMQPDPASRSDRFEGRRLMPVRHYTLELMDPDQHEISDGPGKYLVVNGAKHRGSRDENDRREQTREAVRRHRSKKRAKPKPS